MFKIEPRSAVPVYEQLKRQIRLAIATGRLSDGDRLTSIRDLSIALLVNPNTVAKAYRQLETEGFLEIRAGSGAYVSIDNRLMKSDRAALAAVLVDEFVSEMSGLGIGLEELHEMIRMRSNGEGYDD